jgi:hypothetical protein
MKYVKPWFPARILDARGKDFYREELLAGPVVVASFAGNRFVIKSAILLAAGGPLLTPSSLS